MLYLLLLVLWAIDPARSQDAVLKLNPQGHHGVVSALQFTADGRRLISAGHDRTVNIWDVSNGGILRTIRGQSSNSPGGINCAAVSPDGKYLAVAGTLHGSNPREKSAIRIYDLGTGEIIALLRGHTNTVTTVDFSPRDNNLLASSGLDEIVILWDVARRRSIREYEGHTGTVFSVHFSRDGSRLVSASADQTLRTWKVSGGRLETMRGHTGAVVSARFTSDSKSIVSLSDDQTVRLWDFETGRFVRELARTSKQMANLSITPDSTAALVCYLGQEDQYPCKILPLSPEGREVAFLRHTDIVHATAISPDGALAATVDGRGNEIFLWKTATGDVKRKLESKGQPVFAVGFATDGRYVAFGTHRRSRPAPNAWGEIEGSFDLSPGNPYRIGLGPLVSNDAGFVGPIARAKNGWQLSVDPETSSILRLQRNGSVSEVARRNDANGYKHNAFTFTPNGRYIISGGYNGELTLYTPEGRKVHNFPGHSDAIWSVAVSPDSTRLVSGSSDQTIRVWDIGTGKNLLSIFVSSDSEWIAWTPQGYYTSSVNGGQFIGWLFDRGLEKTPRFSDADELHQVFYRPEAVAEYLKSGRIGASPPTQSDIAAAMPPEVTLRLQQTDGKIWKYRAQIRSDAPVTMIQAYHNGRTVPVKRLAEGQVEIELLGHAGRNTVYVTASRGTATSRGASDSFDITGTGAAKRVSGKLYVLAVGINSYQDNPLTYAVRDAVSVADILAKQKGRRFIDVQTHILKDREVTLDAIEKKLDHINKSVNEGDTRLIFMAGHGRVQRQHLLFDMPVSAGSPASGASLKLSDLLERLREPEDDHPSPIVLMLDTCHSAAVAADVHSAFNNMLHILAPQKTPYLAVYAASAASEVSIEKSEFGGHGAFTKSLLDILEQRSPQDDSALFTDELGVMLRKGVSALSKNQHVVSFVIPFGHPAVEVFQ